MTDATLELVLKNDSGELGRLAEAIDGFSERSELPDDIRFILQLCLEELTLNIMSYGFEDSEDHDIRVDLEMRDGSPGTLTVRIVDDGKAFDPLTDTPEPDIDAAVEDRAVGGLGFHLVREYMDDIAYRREDERNHLTLTKHVQAE